MHLLEIQPPGGATCISKKFGHQVAPHALSYCLGFPYWIISQYQLRIFINQSHFSKVFNSGHQLRSSTRVFNQGHQLGSSTRVSLASLHQLGLHNIDNIDSLQQVFTRFQKALGRTERHCYPMIGPHVHMGPIKTGLYLHILQGYLNHFMVFRRLQES